MRKPALDEMPKPAPHRPAISDENYRHLTKVIAETPGLVSIDDAVGHVLTAYRNAPPSRREREG